MKAVNDLDFLNLFWSEAKGIGSKIIRQLPQCAEPNIGKGNKLMYLIKFSDISGRSWGVKDTLTRVMGQSKTLKILANKINYMILMGRANDVKPMLQKIATGRIKSFSHPRSKEAEKRFGKNTEFLGRGHFRWEYGVHTLTEGELRRIKEYFNL